MFTGSPDRRVWSLALPDAGRLVAAAALGGLVLASVVLGMPSAVGAATGLGQPPPMLARPAISAEFASTAIARATVWTDAGVPYSQTSSYQGYRTDCSGFVSMAWALTNSSGQPLSLVTQTLPNVSTTIPFSQLLPGDALIFNSTADPQNNSHAMLFGGWVDSSETYYYAYQESDGANASIQSFPPAPLDATSQWYAYRYDGIVDDLPAVPASPPIPPNAPSGLWRTGGTLTSISLSWNSSLTATGYVLYRNGVQVATTSSTSTTDIRLTPGSTYSYQVAAVNAAGIGRSSGAVSISTGGGAVAVVARHSGGYWIATSDGDVFAYGGAKLFGSMTGHKLTRPIVGMAATPDGRGYTMVASDGGIFAFGDARYYGSMGGLPLDQPVVGIAATQDGKGYWEVASDGGIFAFGDAPFYGSMGGVALNSPIVGIAATQDGKGYWEVASDGGIFAFGDAPFYGSMGGHPLAQRVVGMAIDPGVGYWEVAADGGIFAFGGAPFYGSMGGQPLDQPITGLAATPTPGGYWMVARDGGIFAEGGAVFAGSPA